MPTPQQIAEFQETVWRYYDQHGRHDLPWRQPQPTPASPVSGAHNQPKIFDPYAIMVSELMLQQTQVARVIPKFEAFMAKFPNAKTLAQSPLADVLKMWSGLGYNRRAKFLWQAAGKVEQEFGGQMPATQSELTQLPGVGANTAGAIATYAYNQPVVFIETNIRSVFIHHFFADHEQVSDADIAQVVAVALPPEQTNREWYWALMDYGTHLKQTLGNHARRSTTYARQSKFEGSRRQVRGAVLRVLGAPPGLLALADLRAEITDERLESVLHDLQTEGMIELRNKHYQLASS